MPKSLGVEKHCKTCGATSAFRLSDAPAMVQNSAPETGAFGNLQGIPCMNHYLLRLQRKNHERCQEEKDQK
jgi:hypothetical protein